MLIQNIPQNLSGHINNRVAYYNKLTAPFTLGCEAECLRDMKWWSKTLYSLDFREFMRYFPSDVRFEKRFDDCWFVPERPKFIKSRPVITDKMPNHTNSVLLKLESIRHYNFLKDTLPFREKKDQAVWRGRIRNHLQRLALVKRWYQHPLCNIGQSNIPAGGRRKAPPWCKRYMTIAEQLHYKFIVSLEGNDVATNLKWVLSSNSLCLMPKPTRETWFMEGTLQPDYHYVLIRDDTADLEEKINYYLANPEAAERIIHNAHTYIKTFTDQRSEQLISLLVIKKYLTLAGQLS